MTNIVLIGPMGAGKTTIGKQLARKLQRTFFDSDKEIEAQTGVDIPTIFEYEGEQGFRQREVSTIAALMQKRNIVLATGGGAVINPANRENLKQSSCVVFLNISVKEQLARTCLDKNRPLLQVDDPKAALEKLRVERLPLYRALADLEIDANSRNMKTVIGKIHCFLQQKNNGMQQAKT